MHNTANAFELGIGVHPAEFSAPTENYVNLAKQYGFNSFRTDLNWENIEKVKGTYSIQPPLKKTNELIKIIDNDKSTTALLILDYGNNIYTPSGYPISQNEIDAFSNYSNWVSNQFKNKVKYYEIWNEWLQGTGIKEKTSPPSDPKIYSDLVKESYKKIKNNDPDAIVMIGSINPTIPKYMTWLSGLIDNGILDYSDAISVHAYSTRISSPGTKSPESGIDEIEKLQNLIVKKTGKQKNIYITEIGYPTMHNVQDLSQDSVAQKIIKFTILARSKPYIKGLWWYDLIDDGINIEEPENNYGFFSTTNAPKKSADSVKELARVVKDDSYHFQENENGTNTITVFITSPNGKKAQISWKRYHPIEINQLNKFLGMLGTM
ncbi:Beta-xylosidase [Serratia proteamaculans]|nr:Beta-xylosidase [Serratia proteamaculans]CAI1569018.1 Beta-xylosidase [Serratia proteamaculans]